MTFCMSNMGWNHKRDLNTCMTFVYLHIIGHSKQWVHTHTHFQDFLRVIFVKKASYWVQKRVFWGYLGFPWLSQRMCSWLRFMPSHLKWPWCLGDHEPNCGGRNPNLVWLVVSKIFYFHPYLGKIPISKIRLGTIFITIFFLYGCFQK